MSVRMTAAERDTFLEQADTGVLATLRRDGSPIALPMWFVMIDGDVHIRTRASARKVGRIARDGRACFVVDSGAAWVDLRSVAISGTMVEVTGDAATAVEDALNDKYRGRGVPDEVPTATSAHYADETMYYRLVPERRELTWDNSKLVRPTA
ncbi:MAG: pyridoxamine 5'-phosphate oxidase family protein [Ilumatobacteraceae bacterium]|nr:pyridoxamine 5'-phosphate oxidase family protein [Ilumatobacteraceae bacterium]